jgi:hypothetical protein
MSAPAISAVRSTIVIRAESSPPTPDISLATAIFRPAASMAY